MEQTSTPTKLADEPMLETYESREQTMGNADAAGQSEKEKSEKPDKKHNTSPENPHRVSNIKRLVSPEEIQQIKSVYCCDLPEELTNKEQIKEYFSEFGEVVRVYISLKKKACTVHYRDHKSAANAKKYGGIYGDKRFTIFWSQSSLQKANKSPTSSKKEDKKSDSAEKDRKPKEVMVEERSKMTLRSRRKVSESASTSSQSKTAEGKSVKSPRSRTSKAKGKASHAGSVTDVNVVFNKNASMKDLQDILQKPAKSAEDKYRVLEARDKLMRMERTKQMKPGVAGRLHGTCPDMCPEKERYLRESQRQVHPYELKQAKEYAMNHTAAIKQYSRSSADQEEPLPHELRPSKVLVMAMNYMVCNIMDLSERKEENLRDWYFYVWDRTRAIRKDITQQQLCDIDAVSLVEQCARFHIHCAERLVSEDITVFDEKINNENLTKCLQTLKHLYHDLAMKGEFCPNEAEFRGYIILMNLGDGNFMWEVQDLRPEIQQSYPVKFAVQVYFALSSGNYVRFFKLVKAASYLNACLMHRYFNQVRTKALAGIVRAYSFQSKMAQFPVSDVVKLLNFESPQQGELFCKHFGLELDTTRTFICLWRNTLPPPSSVFPPSRAINIIESKRTCSIGEVIVGGEIGEPIFKSHVPHTSFNELGMLKSEAWNALDQEAGPRQVIPALVIPQQVAPSQLFAPQVAPPQVAPPQLIPHAEPKIDKLAVIEEICTDLMEELVDETTTEETRKLSESLMEYINKLSVAFLSMYCETFVRDIVRDICTSTLREMKNEKKKEDEKTRKMFEELIEKSSKEMSCSLLEEVVDGVCKSEAQKVLTEEREKHNATKEIVTEIVHETTKSMILDVADELISLEHEERTRKLESLTEVVKGITKKYYFNSLLKEYEKKKQLKISMQGFPAWISTMSLEEQVKWFGSSIHAEEMVYSKRRWSTAFENGLSVSTQTYPLVSVEEDVLKILLKSIKRSGSLKNQLKCSLNWRVIISIPEIWDHRSEVNLASQWVNRCFTEEPLEGSTNKPLCLIKRDLNEFLTLDLSIEKIIGSNRIQRDSSEMTGLVFIVRGNQEYLHEEIQRLNSIITQNLNSQPYLLAVLVIGLEKFPEHKFLNHLNLDSLVKKKFITKHSAFIHHKNGRELPHTQLEEALSWLAQNTEFPPPLEIKPLKTVLQQLLIEELWTSITQLAEENEMFQLIIQDPNDLISIYNEAAELLAEHCCCENYLNLHNIPKSQIELMNYKYLRNFKQILPHWFKSNYMANIKKLTESAKIPKIESLPAKNIEELSNILQDYCSYIAGSARESLKAHQIVMKIIEDDLHGKVPKIRTYSSPWPSVLKVLSGIRLESINFKDAVQPDYSMSVILNENIKRMMDSRNSHWWMKNPIVPTIIEQVQNESYTELSSESIMSSDEKAKCDEVELKELRDSLNRITEAISRQSSQFAQLNSDIRDSVNLV